MSAAELTVIEGGADSESAEDRLLTFLVRADVSEEYNQWEFAELALDNLAPELNRKENAGRPAFRFRDATAQAAAEKIADDIAKRKLMWRGRRVTGATLLNNAEVAHVWEPTTRVAGATYSAHQQLKSPKYDKNRQQVLARLVKRHGRATEEHVALWRSEQERQKRGPLSFQELFDRRIVHAINAQVRPSFKATTQDDLDSMAATLRRRADQLSKGIQPKEGN